MLLLGVLLNADAQTADQASVQVARMSRAVKALGNYAVRFTVTVGEYKTSGDYVVGDERYTLRMGNIEVYGQEGCRYDVDTSRKEIVIDKVDSASGNILNNPISAFDFIGEEYLAEIIAEDAGRVVVKLTPRHNKEVSGVVEVTIDKPTALPKSLVYLPSGESIRVDINHIGATLVTPTKFDRARFEGFEVIDFR